MRAFIAVSIRPNSEISLLADSLREAENARVPRGEELHVTLSFLGDISEKDKDDICKSISSIVHEAFSIKTTSIGAFPQITRARVAFVGIDSNGLLELHSLVSGKIPQKYRETREFVPHLTVARFKRPMDLSVLYRENDGKDFGTYRIEKFTLFRSDLRPDGAVYTPVCTVQLM